MKNIIIISVCATKRNDDQLKKNLVSMLEASDDASEAVIDTHAYDEIKQSISMGETSAILYVGSEYPSIAVKMLCDKEDHQHTTIAIIGDCDFESFDDVDFEHLSEKIFASAGQKFKIAIPGITTVSIATIVGSSDKEIIYLIPPSHNQVVDSKAAVALEYAKSLQAWINNSRES